MAKKAIAERDHCAIARKYADDVVAGRIPACKWVRLACQRQIDDLGRWKKSGPYRFDAERANRVCRFIELLPHIEGAWASPTITLEPWQCFVLTTVFGWVDTDGLRRFRTVYIEVPRKNAKSTLSAGVGLYLLAADGEPGAQVYSAATNREQAHAVWNPARKMVGRTNGLRQRFGVEPMAHSIVVEATASSFKPLSADANSLDGLNIHGAVVDELHAHKTRAVFDVLNSGTGARKQPLMWLITTAGFNRSGVCYEQRTYVTKVLERVHEDETYFGVVYTVDDTDDWTEESTWRKANPNYGVSVLPKDIATMCRQAMLSAQSQNNFLTKRLNVWVNADTAWLNMQSWDACRDQTLDLSDFETQPCYLGLDLAAKTDVNALVLLFPPHQDRDWWAIFGRYYLPEATVEAGVNTNAAHYAGWENEGLMKLTPGEVIDTEAIVDDVDEFMRRFDVREIAMDPYQIIAFTRECERRNLDLTKMIEVPANVRHFSEPMKQMEALVLSGKIRHNDPILTWMMSNVVAHTDARDNIYPRKERPENKIDGAVAAIMALNRATVAEQKTSPYETRGVIFV